MKEDVVFKMCLDTYGSNPQMDIAVEEMSELMKALLKYRRASAKAPTEELVRLRDAIIDELADVKIMVRQMELLFECDSEVAERMSQKVERQLKRLSTRV